jgi:O-methyltransferase|mmetsp:Transcript_6544/g.26275  ORF Transcript_6544/g.26275 Transcript_6544/m.26275 type:complete len:355 (-) Transcript_6544:2725-3789(-)
MRRARALLQFLPWLQKLGKILKTMSMLVLVATVHQTLCRSSCTHTSGHMRSNVVTTDIVTAYTDLFQRVVLNDIYEPGEFKTDGRDWKPEDKMLTMIGRRRLDNIELIVRAVVRGRIPGHFIETGVWRGGASFYAAAILRSLGELGTRRIFMCDSFSGIPEANSPGQRRGMDTEAHLLKTEVDVSEDLVISSGRSLGLPVGNETDAVIRTVLGFFNTSLDALTAEESQMQFSVLRLDGDTYFSTMESLEALYDRLSVGGYVIVDDYIDWHTCREAVEDFRAKNNITDPRIIVEHGESEVVRGIYWRKIKNPCELFDDANSVLTLIERDTSSHFKWPNNMDFVLEYPLYRCLAAR